MYERGATPRYAVAKRMAFLCLGKRLQSGYGPHTQHDPVALEELELQLFAEHEPVAAFTVHGET